MGKVTVRVRLTNLADEVLRRNGHLDTAVRTMEVDALVDTGATGLYLKPSVTKALGLHTVRRLSSRTTNGTVERVQYDPVRLDLQGRTGNFDVVGIGEDVPNLVGQVPLEVLDFVVDPETQTLIGNPDHGGVQMTEEYWAGV